MKSLSRRDFVQLGLGGAGLAACPRFAASDDASPKPVNVHEQLLTLAAKQQAERRARFAAVKTADELQALQASLRKTFLELLGDLPEASAGPPKVRKTGLIEAEDYVIEKLVYESFPGYFVPALLYRPKGVVEPRPGVISPCGHSTEGKAAGTYQMLHVNLVRRGYVVLTYDPVGQGERSQFWDSAAKKSRYNLTCGEHAVLGNPLYLIGSSLATYRIWDGIRALDLLAAHDEVDPERLGCVGNSGGGTLTAYISALDPRVAAAAICCYITTLPRRMGNRIQADPDSDPEQDIFNFVGGGIDHAGLLALRAPKPTLVGAAQLDFFPIEGARESFTEARHLFEVAGATEKVALAESPEKHGLSLPLRTAVYGFFDKWLMGKKADGSAGASPSQEKIAEIPVKPRPNSELLVCGDGQVNISFHSRHLLEVAGERFAARPKQPREKLRDILALNLDEAAPLVEELAAGKPDQATILLVNGNETGDWRDERDLFKALADAGHRLLVVDPRGVGRQRPEGQAVRGKEYTDPLCGVEENIAYNAFLCGTSLASLRVADVLAAVQRAIKESKTKRLAVFGRRDAALISVLTTAVEQAITHVAVEDLMSTFGALLPPKGRLPAVAPSDRIDPAVNAASIVPGLLARYGDVWQIVREIAPRQAVLEAGRIQLPRTNMPELVGPSLNRDVKAVLNWLSK
jgi:dienelactone hydrolase